MSTNPVNILFDAPASDWEDYGEVLPEALDAAGVKARLAREISPEEVDYIVTAPGSRISDYGRFGRLRAVLSLWAGVEKIVGNPTLAVPLARMVDPAMTRSMVEWVVAHVMRHHKGIDTHILGQDGQWRAPEGWPVLAAERVVTILGIGALGAEVGAALGGLGFDVRGWSRGPKEIAGIDCHHGDAGLDAALEGAGIVVLLLPDTPDTAGIIDASRLARMARGGALINPGRGPLIVDDDLLAALNSGQLGHATLDVFRQEPLPRDHPFWAHPRVTVTPHIAAQTRPDTASAVIAANIARDQRGEPLLHLADRSAGY